MKKYILIFSGLIVIGLGINYSYDKILCNSVTGTMSSCKVSLDKNNITTYRETIDCGFSMHSECANDGKEVFRYKTIDGEWKEVNRAGNPKK